MKKNHKCVESGTCCCGTLVLEPDEDCPLHGGGVWPPRCEICGRFMHRETISLSELAEKDIVEVNGMLFLKERQKSL